MELTQSPAGESPPRATPAALGCHTTAAKSTEVVVSTWPSTKAFSRCHGFSVAVKGKRAAQQTRLNLQTRLIYFLQSDSRGKM